LFTVDVLQDAHGEQQNDRCAGAIPRVYAFRHSGAAILRALPTPNRSPHHLTQPRANPRANEGTHNQAFASADGVPYERAVFTHSSADVLSFSAPHAKDGPDCGPQQFLRSGRNRQCLPHQRDQDAASTSVRAHNQPNACANEPAFPPTDTVAHAGTYFLADHSG